MSPSLTKCEQIWDYVYIDDVTKALLSVGEKGRSGIVYSIGHGDNWPLKKYIDTIHEMIDPDLQISFGDIPYKGEVLPSAMTDLQNIQRDTGYSPTVNFDEGIARVINAVKNGKGRGSGSNT